MVSKARELFLTLIVLRLLLYNGSHSSGVRPIMRTAILYSEKMREYDLGHVLTGERYEGFMCLFRERLGDDPAFEIVEPGYATEADLKLVHTEEYIRRVERCDSRDPHDTPLSPGVVRAARLLAGAGKLAGELVQSGAFRKAIVIGGGNMRAEITRPGFH